MAISIADDSCTPTRPLGHSADPEKACPPKQSMWHRLGFRRWLGRESQSPPGGNDNNSNNNNNAKPHDNLTRRLSRRVGVGLPRATTFKRQNSERRDRLTPFEPEPRAVSADRRRTLSVQRTRSPQPDVGHRLSAPEVQWRDKSVDTMVERPSETNDDTELRSDWDPFPGDTDVPEGPSGEVIELELEKKWILNLSMHFRDRSQREKFFVTYAEAPNRWRRVTISCDYRDAPPDSLERDLKELRYQRDKCARIYESLRDSLPEIQFYDTVTNLKLETQNGRLHVHVTEDVNEIIPYPPVSCVGHLQGALFIPENKLHFDSHLSGFVYNVQLDGKAFIKKEIPGPETVDEFLYEINALHALSGSPYVIQVEGIVVDDRREVVKGLLISYSEQGALVDILYEERGEIPWARRERWASQITHGLCEIHEAGYVQGDFTLSNIVVDADNNARIIDINRRGCPVGWEPPEIATKIESNQRISMYIGVKTDLFQLGMTLWALAMQDDEPERQDRPLILDEDANVPEYYRRLVSICLSPAPRHRLSAKELVAFFPRDITASHYFPSETIASLDYDKDRIPLNVPSSAPLSHSPALDGFMDKSFDLPRRHSSRDDGDSLSQCGSNFATVSPYVERNSRSTLVDGEVEVCVAELDGDSETYTLSPDGERHVQPLTSTSERNFDDQHFSQRFKDAELSYNTGDAGVVKHTDSDIALGAGGLRGDTVTYEEPHKPLLGVHDYLRDRAGARGHADCPLANTSSQPLPDSVQYHESPLLLSDRSTDLYPRPKAELRRAQLPDRKPTRPQQVLPHSVPSLLDSVLPINPAHDISKQDLIPANAEQPASISTLHSAIDRSFPGFQHATCLSNSKLPINPAFTEHSSPA